MQPDAAPVRTESSGAGAADGAASTPETERARRTVPPPRSAPESTPASGTAEPDGTSAATDGATPDGTRAEADGLTARERDILAFEQQWWRHAGAKEQAVRDRFNLSATRYYQLLNGLLDNPAALAAEPVLVGRLRRLRSSRARNRRR